MRSLQLPKETREDTASERQDVSGQPLLGVGAPLPRLFTSPYRPRTNGKAERFIRTLTDGWPYGGVDATNAGRRARLHAWLTYYNFHRSHRALGGQPPAQRLAERNNAAGAYS